MKNILVAGFKGEDNSSKILIDKIDNKDKLYLENDFAISEEQLKTQLSKNSYNEIIIFEQKPVTRKIYIELSAHKKSFVYYTNYDFNVINQFLKNNNYKTVISCDAGDYLCNNIFFWFKLIKAKQYNIYTRTSIKNITDINHLANTFYKYIKVS